MAGAPCIGYACRSSRWSRSRLGSWFLFSLASGRGYKSTGLATRQWTHARARSENAIGETLVGRTPQVCTSRSTEPTSVDREPRVGPNNPPADQPVAALLRLDKHQDLAPLRVRKTNGHSLSHETAPFGVRKTFRPPAIRPKGDTTHTRVRKTNGTVLAMEQWESERSINLHSHEAVDHNAKVVGTHEAEAES